MTKSSANSQQVLTVLKNTLRFVWKSTEEFMDRRAFGRDVLFGLLGLNSDDLLCLQRNAKEKYYDVTCYTITKMEEVKGLAARLADGLLNNFQVRSLCRTGERIVTVHLYNPWVTEEATRYFLTRYATVLSGMGEIRDSLGIWTGKRQFRVMLEDDPHGYDGFCHPPASFTIGTNRGYLVYAGQPMYCRQCASYGHVATACKQMRCRNCDGLGHTMKDCDRPKKCSLCGSERHLFKHCPEVVSSYADATRRESAVAGVQRMDRPMVDDPHASSLRAIEDVLAELARDREIETTVAVSSDAAPLPAESGDSREKLVEEAESSEENSAVAEWATVEKRRGKGKRKRVKTSVPLSPPSSPTLVGANSFNVFFSEDLEGMQVEKEAAKMQESNDDIVTSEETAPAAAATEGEGLKSGGTGESSTHQDVTASDISRLLPCGVPGECLRLEVSLSDTSSVQEGCPPHSEDSPPGPEHSFPLKEPNEEEFL